MIQNVEEDIQGEREHNDKGREETQDRDLSLVKKPRNSAESGVWDVDDGCEDRTATQGERERQKHRVVAVDSRQRRDSWMTRSRKRKRTHKKKRSSI